MKKRAQGAKSEGQVGVEVKYALAFLKEAIGFLETGVDAQGYLLRATKTLLRALERGEKEGHEEQEDDRHANH